MNPKLSNLESHLKKHIIGQDDVVKEVSEILRMGELGLADTNRPKGSFLFLGPTGVGKTELTLCYTRYLFGEKHLARFDMSEFQHPDSVLQFLGTNTHRGTFHQRISATGGWGTILFDEVEKAHPPVLDLLLQILDVGRLTVGDGTQLDLTSYYIVLTSNIASKAVVTARQQSGAALRRFVKAQAMQTLRPELFARIDSVQVFNRLTWENTLLIAEKIMQEEKVRLGALGVDATRLPGISEIAQSVNLDLVFGVRPLRRTIRSAVIECWKIGSIFENLKGVNMDAENI